MNPEAHVRRAEILQEQHRPDEAMEELRRALTLDPEHAIAHSRLAMCLLEEGATEEQSDERVRRNGREALAEANAGVGAAPLEPFTHFALSVVQYKLKRYSDARRAIEEALRLEPAVPDFHAWLAWILLAEHKPADASESAERALAIDPEHVSALNAQANAKRLLRQAGESEQTLESALRTDPRNAYTHANLGWVHLEQGRTAEAQASFAEALRLDPSLDNAREGLITAIKAKNPIYRIFLSWVFALSKFPPQVRTLIVIGVFVLYRVISQVGKSNPSLEPIANVAMVVYLAFVCLVWFADPFFNLLLMLHPVGRHALSDRQRKQSSIFGVVVAAAAAALLLGIVLRDFTVGIAGAAIMSSNFGLIMGLGARRGVMKPVFLTIGALVLAGGAGGLLLYLMGIDQVGLMVSLSFLAGMLSTWLGFARRN